MTNPAIPATETARLRSLRGLDLLDTPDEERFDRYTRLAQKLFAVPIAQVNLVDENRQWSKSQQGELPRETARSQSFCAYSILSPKLFVVEDTLQDPRFVDNPLVTGDAGVRFYAGCPLSAPDGNRIGTLCIMDRDPRSLSREDCEALSDLANLVERELASLSLFTVDELTGVSNRRGLGALAAHALRVCDRHCEPASLLLLSLTELGSIVDRHGHAGGNAALVEFTNLTQEAFRESDTVARLRGGEFCVLLTGAGAVAASECIERLQSLLRDHNRQKDKQWELACFPLVIGYDRSRHRSFDDLLDEAQNRMFVLMREHSRRDVPGPAIA